MSAQVYMQVVPYDKDLVLLALEAGVHGLVVPDEHLKDVQGLARCDFIPTSKLNLVHFAKKEDELDFAKSTQASKSFDALAKGWEIIPVENLLAQPAIADTLCLEVTTLVEAKLALGILEKGVKHILFSPESQDIKALVPNLHALMALSSVGELNMPLEVATITEVRAVGLGHRVCVDTLSVLECGQGMLTGNSSAFTFLVHAETEENNYVNSRPFRINAGAVHAYAMMPNDKTAYLEELKSGHEVLIVNANGTCSSAVIGRVKVEVRPMLYIEAVTAEGKKGAVFLQNAETIRVVSEKGKPMSVVTLKEGDKILCHTDTAGRHFGMRIDENIQE